MSNETKFVMTLWLMASLRGGVGKTKTARLLSSTFLSTTDLTWIGIDTDDANEDRTKATYGLSALWPDHAIKLSFKSSDGSKTNSMISAFSAKLAEIIEEEKYENVVVDVGAGEAIYLLNLMIKEGLMADLAAGKHQIKLMIPLGGAASTHKTVEDINEWINRPENRSIKKLIEPVIVLDAVKGSSVSDIYDRNGVFDINVDFPTWVSNPLRSALGWKELVIPTLIDPAAYDAYEADLRDGLVLPPAEWARIKDDDRVKSQMRRKMRSWIASSEEEIRSTFGIGE